MITLANHHWMALSVRTVAAAFLLALLHGVPSCDAGEEPRGEPAAEAAALKDLQVLLERLGGDQSEQPQERVEILQALARVREALDSWAASVAYYDSLIAGRPGGPLCAIAFSGALRARIARDGNLAGAHAYLAKDALAAAANSNDMTNHVRQLQGHLGRMAGFFNASAAKQGPPIRTMPNLQFDKDEARSFWKVMPPPWINSPPPQKAAPNQPAVPTPATALRLTSNLAANPVLPNTAARIQFVPAVTTVQPDMLKRITLIPEPPATTK